MGWRSSDREKQRRDDGKRKSHNVNDKRTKESNEKKRVRNSADPNEIELEAFQYGLEKKK